MWVCVFDLRVLLVCTFLVFFNGVTPSLADWINLTGAETAPNIAEIAVTDKGVEVALEISAGDLRQFSDILPDKAFGANPPSRPSLEDRLVRFSSEGLKFETEEGTILPVEIKLVEPRIRKDRASAYTGMINPQTGLSVPGPPADKRVIYAKLFYPFDELPKNLKITPPQDEDGRAAVTIGFITEHNDVPVIDFRFLSDSASLNLNWDDPWYSKFDSPNLTRHHKDALMGFMYVEPRSIRIEALARLRDIEQWTDLGLAEGDVIGAEAQDALLKNISEFFVKSLPIKADNELLKPSSSRASFVKIENTGLSVIEEPTQLDRSTALTGIVTSYEIDHLPEEVLLDWQLFDDRQEQVMVTLYDPVGPFLAFATSDEREVKWQNFLKNYEEPSVKPVPLGGNVVLNIPVISVILVLLAIAAFLFAWLSTAMPRNALIGGVACLVCAVLAYPFAVVNVVNPFKGPPEHEDLEQITQTLIGNLYVAMDEHDEQKRKSAVATSSTDEQIESIEDEARRGLIIDLAGGSKAREYLLSNMAVRNVSGSDKPGGVSLVASWDADVSGGHWGHAHQRDVSFEAVVDIVPDSGNWKLAGLTITNRN